MPTPFCCCSDIFCDRHFLSRIVACVAGFIQSRQETILFWLQTILPLGQIQYSCISINELLAPLHLGQGQHQAKRTPRRPSMKWTKKKFTETTTNAEQADERGSITLCS